MGWLSSSGSVARIIGPVFASYAFQYGGPRLVFAAMIVVNALTFLILAISYKILRPKNEKTNIINA